MTSPATTPASSMGSIVHVGAASRRWVPGQYVLLSTGAVISSIDGGASGLNVLRPRPGTSQVNYVQIPRPPTSATSPIIKARRFPATQVILGMFQATSRTCRQHRGGELRHRRLSVLRRRQPHGMLYGGTGTNGWITANGSSRSRSCLQTGVGVLRWHCHARRRGAAERHGAAWSAATA